MALDALGGVCVLVQRHGMCGRAAEAGAENQAQSQKPPYCPHKLPPTLTNYFCTSITVSPPKPPGFASDHAKLLFWRQLGGLRVSPLASRKAWIETRGMGFPPHSKVKSPTRLACGGVAQALSVPPISLRFLSPTLE